MKYIIRLILSIAMVAALCEQAGCSSPASSPDAGVVFHGPSTGFGGPIAPQGGTITQVIAGTCLTGGGSSGHVTVGADTTCVQARVTGTCTTGQAMTGVNTDGTVVCSTISSISGLATGDLVVATSPTAVGPYGGSTPSACAAGAITTQPTLGPDGTLVNNCTNLTGVANASGAGVATRFISGNGTWTGLSSNLRVNASSIDLSTAVVMPGSLIVKGLAGTAQSVSTSGLTDDVALSSTTTILRYTGTADATWGGFTSTGDERWVYVENPTLHVLTLTGLDASTPLADRITPPHDGSDGFEIPPFSGTWIHYDTAATTWILSGIFGDGCTTGEFVTGVNSDGTVTCSTPSGGGTVTSVSGSAPLSGTVTTSGSLSLNYTSNFRLSGSSLDLSTAVTMPGTLDAENGVTLGDLVGVTQSNSHGSGTIADEPLNANTTILYETGTGTINLAGMTGDGVDGRMVRICNEGTGVLEFLNASSTETTVSRRFDLAGATTNILNTQACIDATWDATVSRWRLNNLDRFFTLATSSAASIGASLSVVGPTTGSTVTWSGSTNLNTITVHHPAGAQPSSNDTILADQTSTYNTSSAALTSTAISASDTSTKSSGTNTLTDVGISATASGGDINWALVTLDGDVWLNASSGSTRFGGVAVVGGDLDLQAHINSGDGTHHPTPSTGCGASPGIVGGDSAGRITLGSGAGAGCVLTFYSSTWLGGNAPACTASWSGGPAYISAASTTSITIAAASSFTNGSTITYHCDGVQ